MNKRGQGGIMLKKVLVAVVVIFLISTLVACSGDEDTAIFQEEKVEELELEIAVVDKGQIWSDSLQTEDYQNKLKEKLESIEAELAEADSNDLDEVEKVELHDELYDEVRELREDLRLEAEEKINQKIANIAESQEYQVVLNKEETHFGGEDITELVINLLDESFEENSD